jgi:hypothetical protein
MRCGGGGLGTAAIAFGLAAALALPPAAAAAPSVDAKAIVDRVDRLLRGDSSQGEVTMSVVTRRWTRTLTMRVWSEGTEKALIKVTGPAKEAGTVTLKTGNDIWNYLPKIDRTIRVPTSMMMAAWLRDEGDPASPEPLPGLGHEPAHGRDDDHRARSRRPGGQGRNAVGPRHTPRRSCGLTSPTRCGRIGARCSSASSVP